MAFVSDLEMTPVDLVTIMIEKKYSLKRPNLESHLENSVYKFMTIFMYDKFDR